MRRQSSGSADLPACATRDFSNILQEALDSIPFCAFGPGPEECSNADTRGVSWVSMHVAVEVAYEAQPSALLDTHHRVPSDHGGILDCLEIFQVKIPCALREEVSVRRISAVLFNPVGP